jgi:hypothetical protein
MPRTLAIPSALSQYLYLSLFLSNTDNSRWRNSNVPSKEANPKLRGVLWEMRLVLGVILDKQNIEGIPELSKSDRSLLKEFAGICKIVPVSDTNLHQRVY